MSRSMNNTDVRTNDADLGQPTWIETDRGFPLGGFGADPDLRPAPDVVLASTDGRSPTDRYEYTAGHGADIVAFGEFLAGTAFDDQERAWLVDAMGREFLLEPGPALEQLVPIANAVATIPEMEPAERANNRHKALTAMYRAEVVRNRNGMAETPIMTVIRAHNPPLFMDKTGLVIVADALEARTDINDLVLDLGGHTRAGQPNLRTDLADDFRELPAMMQVELAGSQIRLVVLRAWLAELSQPDMDQLRARLADVVDTATDLDMVTLQLSFRSMIEAFEADGAGR